MLLRGLSVSAWDRGHTIHGGTITGVGERGGSHLQEVKEVKERGCDSETAPHTPQKIKKILTKKILGNILHAPKDKN